MAKPKLCLIPAAQGSKLFSVLPSSGVGDFDFTRSGSATRINSQGLIEAVVSGQSRLNYPLIDGKVVGCPHHILEPARTNKVPTSNDFDGSGWLASSLTATDNQVVSPDGTLNASKLEMTGDGSLRNQTEASFNNGYAYSIFVKKGNSRYVTIRSAFFTQSIIVGFDLDTLSAQTNGKIEDYGNDWYRLSISKNISGDADKSGYFYLYLPDSLGDQTSVSGNYVYAYGGQIEDGSYPTSYIPTNGAAVTRSAETANGAGDATTFNDSEGVLMAEIANISENQTTTVAFSLSDGSTSNAVSVYYFGTSGLYYDIFNSDGTRSSSKPMTKIQQTYNNKISLKYKSGDIALWVNGFEVNTNTGTLNLSGLSELNLDYGSGGFPFYGKTKQLQYYNSALTDSELEQLTSWISFTDMAEGQQYSIQ